VTENGESPTLIRLADEFRFLSELAIDLFRKGPDAIIIVNGETGIIQLVNDQAEFLTGYHRSELRGKPVEMLIPDASHEVHISNRAGYMDNPRVRRMYEHAGLKLKSKSGREIPVEIMLAPVSTARGIFVIATVRRKDQLWKLLCGNGR